MKVQIREAVEADVPGLLPLLSLLERQSGATVDEDQAQDILRTIRSFPHCCVYVAEADRQIAGMFELFILPNLAHRAMPSAIIEDVAVRQDLQGKGIGRQMMQFAMDRAKAAGCYKIALSSGLQREAAHQFYEGIGFERYGYCFSVIPIP